MVQMKAMPMESTTLMDRVTAMEMRSVRMIPTERMMVQLLVRWTVIVKALMKARTKETSTMVK